MQQEFFLFTKLGSVYFGFECSMPVYIKCLAIERNYDRCIKQLLSKQMFTINPSGIKVPTYFWGERERKKSQPRL